MNLTPAIPQRVMRFGAPAGRDTWDHTRHFTDRNPSSFTGRMYLRHIPLDNGGYDTGGAYWGIGKRLYGYASEDDSINGFTRAYDREDARAIVLREYPHAKFFR